MCRNTHVHDANEGFFLKQHRTTLVAMATCCKGCFCFVTEIRKSGGNDRDKSRADIFVKVHNRRSPASRPSTSDKTGLF